MKKNIFLGLVAAVALSLGTAALSTGCDDNKSTGNGGAGGAGGAGGSGGTGGAGGAAGNSGNGGNGGNGGKCVSGAPANNSDFLNSCPPGNVSSVSITPQFPDKAPDGVLPNLP